MEKPPKCEKNGLKKGAWTAEEDQKLIDYIQEHGHGRWRNVPKNAGLKRCGKSCRLRWKNYLKPDIKRGRFSFEEEETIIQLHSILGNKWSAIASRLPGRTDNEIKNYWNTRIRKRLLRMGINPVTHSPHLDLLELSSILNSSLYNLSQLNVQSLLGADPAVNPNLLTLSNSLLLSQCKNMQFLPQNLEKDHLSNPYVQNELQTYQGNQPHNTLQEFQASTMWSNSSTPFSNDTQLMQANADQFSLNTANFSCQNSMPSWYQNNEDQFSNSAYSTVPLPEFSNQYFFNQIPSENQMFQSNNNNKTQNFGFGSVLSTPSSSSTPLNSSMTYINGSSTEDERDSYCNNVMFEIPNSFDVDGLMGAYRS